MFVERRERARARVLRRGKIVYNNGRVSLGCVLLDLSPCGAQLRTDDWMSMPEKFELQIENGPSHLVEVRHRGMDRSGVQFIDRVA